MQNEARVFYAGFYLSRGLYIGVEVKTWDCVIEIYARVSAEMPGFRLVTFNLIESAKNTLV
jgi:hypothetical protein